MRKLPFLDRERELKRLKPARRRAGGMAVVYGRRRIGKTRLIREAVKDERNAVFFTADERETPLQIRALAASLAAAIPGFDEVEYPGWDALLDRLVRDHPRRFILVLDEFPHLVAQESALPSLLQTFVERDETRDVTLVLCGSSQRMMQGLVLDAGAPLYGRADQILRIGPLPPGHVARALGLRRPADAVAAWSVFGGVPRYWELARAFDGVEEAAATLVLDPQGPLHAEPRRLLLDDTRDVAQAASILTLVGRGAHRLSEIAGRLGKPATSMTRPVARLVELGVLRRETPFGTSPKASKRSLYKIDDPFLRFWFRLVEPNRSLLNAGDFPRVSREVLSGLPGVVSAAWEDLARMSVPRMKIAGKSWGAASRYWGPGSDRAPLEIDVVATSTDGEAILVGEASWGSGKGAAQKPASLSAKSARFPHAKGRKIVRALFLREKTRAPRDDRVLLPSDVMATLT